MKADYRKLYSKFQTGKKMYDLVDKTAGDLKKIKISGKPLSDMPLSDYFFLVKNIPYRQDPKPREIIARPKYLFKYRKNGLDCKKKALLVAAWAKNNNIPFRFIASSNRPNRHIHHVFPELYFSGRYVITDATYPKNSINMKKHFTKKIVL